MGRSRFYQVIKTSVSAGVVTLALLLSISQVQAETINWGNTQFVQWYDVLPTADANATYPSSRSANDPLFQEGFNQRYFADSRDGNAVTSSTNYDAANDRLTISVQSTGVYQRDREDGNVDSWQTLATASNEFTMIFNNVTTFDNPGVNLSGMGTSRTVINRDLTDGTYFVDDGTAQTTTVVENTVISNNEFGALDWTTDKALMFFQQTLVDEVLAAGGITDPDNQSLPLTYAQWDSPSQGGLSAAMWFFGLVMPGVDPNEPVPVTEFLLNGDISTAFRDTNGDFYGYNGTRNVVPEPATMTLFGLGVLGAGLRRKKVKEQS